MTRRISSLTQVSVLTSVPFSSNLKGARCRHNQPVDPDDWYTKDRRQRAKLCQKI
ncbi:hypothetical protein [Roseovarius sp. EL26]|uniref:hypothetical protein n=1 Tax=Roseovarius sp. EL26 TaxID=2126672 RepID=UPI0013C45EDB|nr:hypothetical protein [Roseovarius sp. EL26]